METRHIKKDSAHGESRRKFLTTSAKVAVGAATLPIVMTLSSEEAQATGSGRRRHRRPAPRRRWHWRFWRRRSNH